MPKRVQNWALILSPMMGLAREAVGFGRQACREAHMRGFEPIFPLLYCLTYMTEEEVDKSLKEITMRWARRVGVIWVCLPPGKAPKLDVTTHDVLLYNEGHMRPSLRAYDAPSRLRVYRFWLPEQGHPRVDSIARKEVNQILRLNITDGLFRGML